MNPTERLLTWIGVNLIFGFLPVLFSGLIYVWSGGKTELIRVEDWMFPVITLLATTVVDLLVEEIPRATKAAFWMVLFLFIVIASWLVMANSVNRLFTDQAAVFDRHTLIVTAMYVTLCAFFSTGAIQWNLARSNSRGL